MKHSEYVTIIEGFGKKAIKDALIKVAIKQLPFLMTGPWNFVLVKIVTKLAEELADQGEIAVFFKYVDFRTDIQAKDFEAAMIYNHTIQQIGTEDEKKIAEQKLKDALTLLVSLKS